MELFYKELGDESAPLIMFIHGGGVSGWMWKKQAEHFQDYHLVIPDLPGHGGSGKIELTIDDSARRLLALIEDKGKGKRTIAAGFSLGAQVLVAMLGMRPDLISDAMINSALVKPMPLAKPLIRSMAAFHPLVRSRTFSKIQARSMYIDDEDFEIYYRESRSMRKATFVAMMEENMSFAVPDGFGSTGCRMLATVGEKERGVMKRSLEELTRRNPNCKGLVVPGAGHGFSLAEPERFNRLVRRWLHGGEPSAEWLLP